MAVDCKSDCNSPRSAASFCSGVTAIEALPDWLPAVAVPCAWISIAWMSAARLRKGLTGAAAALLVPVPDGAAPGAPGAAGPKPPRIESAPPDAAEGAALQYWCFVDGAEAGRIQGLAKWWE